MRTTLAALLFFACAPPIDGADFVADAGGDLPEGVRIPVSVSLAPGTVFAEPLVAGRPSRIAVFASPGARADLYVTAAGPGAGSCPSTLGGTCLGLKGKPIRLGSAIAASSGPGASFAVFAVVPPAGFSGQIWLQGFERQGSSPALAGPVLSSTVTLRSPTDSDGDGLTDAYELQIGTDVLDVDSDNDGLTDFYEQIVLGSSPLLADTDDDGLSDGDEEQVHGTLVLNPDTDGDTVLDGEEIALGSSPTSPDTDGDGLDDGEEVALGTSLLLVDTDGDGLDDLAEVVWGSDPLLADGDGDGLNDAQEQGAGTSPFLADTDGDGYRDGDEFFSGFDPATPQSSFAVTWRAPVALNIFSDDAAQFPAGVQGATGTLTVSWTAPGSPFTSDASSAGYVLSDSLVLDLTGFTLTHTDAFATANVFDAFVGGAVNDGISGYIPVNTTSPTVSGIVVVRWYCFAGEGVYDVLTSTDLPLWFANPALGCGADMFIDNSGTVSYAFIDLQGAFTLVP